MSWFDSLLGAVGGAGIPFISGAVSGWQGTQAIEDQNAANERMLGLSQDFASKMMGRQENFASDMFASARDYNTFMSNTSMQRGVRDLKAAGLNPMLGYMKGAGASTPTMSAPGAPGAMGVSTPHMESRLPALVSAAQIQRLAAETANIEAQTETERNRPENVAADTRSKEQGIQLSKSQVNDIEERLRVLMPQQHALMASEITLNGSRDRLTYEQFKHELERSRLTKEEVSLVLEEINKYRLERPGRENMSAMERESWIKRNLSPFVRDIQGTTGSGFLLDRVLRRR